MQSPSPIFCRLREVTSGHIVRPNAELTLREDNHIKHKLSMTSPLVPLASNAVRALAFKWIRIIWKCWQSRTPYNEVIYLESLRKKGSSLLKFAAEHQQ